MVGAETITCPVGIVPRGPPNSETRRSRASSAVAGGQGWTILTPLALHHAARFREGVDVAPLPFEPLQRTLSLSARAGVFGRR